MGLGMTKFWGVVTRISAIGCIGMLTACMEYHGTVVDAVGLPIKGAKLVVTDVMGSEWVTFTNADGYYFVDNLSDYGHDIFASKDGYVTQVYDSQINFFPEVNFVMLNDGSDVVNSGGTVARDAPVNTTGQIELHRIVDGV